MTPKDKVVIPEGARLAEEELYDAVIKADVEYEKRMMERKLALLTKRELPSFPDFEQLRRIFIADAQLQKLFDMGYRSPEEIKEIEKRAREELIKEIESLMAEEPVQHTFNSKGVELCRLIKDGDWQAKLKEWGISPQIGE